MGNLLHKEKPLKEVLRENKRLITRAVRELDRERAGLEREEKRLTMEIKKMARENQMPAVKTMAKDLVRTRQHIAKFIEMRSHLQGCALKLQTVKSHQAMAEAMQSTAVAMQKVNKAVNPQTLTKMMAQFEKENTRTEMMQELMGDALDDALADDADEDEEERIVGQVLDEIGISFGEELPATAGLARPAGAVTEAVPHPMAEPVGLGGGGGGSNHNTDTSLSELEARLNNLKR